MAGSNDLTAAQTAAMCDTIIQAVAYASKMRRRMEELGYPKADSLYVDTCLAHDALVRLRMNLHYLHCDAAKREQDARLYPTATAPTANPSP